ncbi:unnamed protein product [Euphydryas editha]|uniref:Uncharacterized protein n=1 Tax=Euphydryas editha TaxID=104508 RepID=A0AAU9TSY8_EUPED|nr:unnamed protein product [Euphydryas editha]
MRPILCVKCAQAHKTSDCPKHNRNTPAQCALWQGAHPANYNGCEVYRQILARRNNKYGHRRADRCAAAKDTFRDTIPRRNTAQKSSSIEKEDELLFYARVTRNVPNKVITENTIPNLNHNLTVLENLLTKQIEKIDIFLQQMSTLMSLMTTLITKLQGKPALG